jgi:hypothetical protein
MRNALLSLQLPCPTEASDLSTHDAAPVVVGRTCVNGLHAGHGNISQNYSRTAHFETFLASIVLIGILLAASVAGRTIAIVVQLPAY